MAYQQNNPGYNPYNPGASNPQNQYQYLPEIEAPYAPIDQSSSQGVQYGARVPSQTSPVQQPVSAAYQNYGYPASNPQMNQPNFSQNQYSGSNQSNYNQYQYSGNQGYNQPMMQGQPIQGQPIHGQPVYGVDIRDRNIINRRNRFFFIFFGFMIIFGAIMLLVLFA